jgi:hypothetical protein
VWPARLDSILASQSRTGLTGALRKSAGEPLRGTAAYALRPSGFKVTAQFLVKLKAFHEPTDVGSWPDVSY